MTDNERIELITEELRKVFGKLNEKFEELRVTIIAHDSVTEQEFLSGNGCPVCALESLHSTVEENNLQHLKELHKVYRIH